MHFLSGDSTVRAGQIHGRGYEEAPCTDQWQDPVLGSDFRGRASRCSASPTVARTRGKRTRHCYCPGRIYRLHRAAAESVDARFGQSRLPCDGNDSRPFQLFDSRHIPTPAYTGHGITSSPHGSVDPESSRADSGLPHASTCLCSSPLRRLPWDTGLSVAWLLPCV